MSRIRHFILSANDGNSGLRGRWYGTGAAAAAQPGAGSIGVVSSADHDRRPVGYDKRGLLDDGP